MDEMKLKTNKRTKGKLWAFDKGEENPFKKCFTDGCEKKTALIIKLKELHFAVCSEHLEGLYKDSFFDDVDDINYMKMVEGIIKYGSLEKWTSKLREDKNGN